MTGYELAQLPKTDTGRRMISRVSPIYDQSLFAKTFYDALGSQYDLVRRFFESLREQSFTSLVDWAIECQERKYSIKPDSSLSLEERRARLKIQSALKRPLCPGILERYALEACGVKVVCDESEPGFIKVIAEQRSQKFFSWLVEEKPAHLALNLQVNERAEGGFYVGILAAISGRVEVEYDSGEPDIYIGVIAGLFGKVEFEAEPRDCDFSFVMFWIKRGTVEVEFESPNLYVASYVTQEQGSVEVTTTSQHLGNISQITLFFEFLSGTRQYTFNDVKENITLEDLKLLSNYVAQNEMLIVDDEAASGIRYVEVKTVANMSDSEKTVLTKQYVIKG